MVEQRSRLEKSKSFWHSHDGLRVIAYVVLISVIVLSFHLLLNLIAIRFDRELDDLVLMVLGLVFVVILISFVAVYTKPLPGCDDRTSNDVDTQKSDEDVARYVRLKRYWMVLSYAFMIFSLVAAILPFAMEFTQDLGDAETSNYLKVPIGRPIAIVLGCIDVENGERTGLRCDKGSDGAVSNLSWILTIGSNLTASPTPNGYQENWNKLKQLKSKLDDRLTELKEAENDLTKIANEIKQLSLQDEGDQASKIADLKAMESQASTRLMEIEDAVIMLKRDMFDVRLVLQGYPNYQAKGGLVIPFYLIVLSMFGAAISLTRRIPEYQKQAAPGYVGTENAPSLSPPMLREYLVFQIIQFVSAPFLATVAYLLFEPATTAVTVGLAFAAGFSSEVVLVWLRDFVDKIRPKGAVQTQ
jgi:hypothetical protein